MTESEIIERIQEIKLKRDEFERISKEIYSIVRREIVISPFDYLMKSFFNEIDSCLKKLRVDLAELRGE